MECREAFDTVVVREEEFEAFAETPDGFDLVYSAQAWHHVDPEVRYRKAATVLWAGGRLALYWKEGQDAYRRSIRPARPTSST